MYQGLQLQQLHRAEHADAVQYYFDNEVDQRYA